MRNFDVVTVGSAILDVFLHSRSLMLERHKSGRREVCVPYGVKVEVEEILFETGGGAINSAVTFARQGLKTAVIAKIGSDFAGRKIIEELKKEKINSQFIVKERKGMTDYSTILWAPDGGRTILVYRGKTRLEVKDIPWAKIKTKRLYISSTEGNLNLVSSVRRLLPGIKIAWNLGERELRQKDKVLKILPDVEVLALNKEEAAQLLTIKQYNNLPAGKAGITIKELLKKAQKLPCRLILITDGSQGAYLWDGKNWWWSGVYKVPLKEATGAGDAYGAGFVVGMIKGYPLEKCLQGAAANAASVVSFPGAKRGILTNEEARKWFQKKLIIKKLF